jgi:ABC-2 type transport system ATP-binding protein
MLTGYLEATSGSIEVDGVDIMLDRLAVQNKIGYLSEGAPLYPDMSIWQYLEYVAELRGIEPGSRLAAVKDALAATDLTDRATDLIDTLSKGYKQRVGVAQAIIHKPEILILDEPTNGLDPTQILAMRGLIKELSKNATVIISTHILQEVEAICDRVIIILNGRIVIDSKLTELKHNNNISLAVKENLNQVETALKQMEGIKKITLVSTMKDINLYSLETNQDIDKVSPQIAKKIIDSGWNLYRMHSDYRDLETVFKEVNSGLKGVAHV